MFKMKRHTQIVLMRTIALFMFIVTVAVSTIAIYASVPDQEVEQEEIQTEESEASDLEEPEELPEEESELPEELPEEPDKSPERLPEEPQNSPEVITEVLPTADPVQEDTAESNAAVYSLTCGGSVISGTGLDEVIVSFDTEQLEEDAAFDLILSADEAGGVSVEGASFAQSENGIYRIEDLSKGASGIAFGNLGGVDFTIRAEGLNTAFEYGSALVQEDENEYITGTVMVTAVSEQTGELAAMLFSASAEEQGESICINDKAKFTVSVQNYESGTEASRSQEFIFNLNFSFDDSTGYVPGISNRVVYFEIPDELTELKSSSSETTGDVVDTLDTGLVVGNYSIEGNRIVFTYTNDEWLQSHNSEVKGFFTFKAKVKTDLSINQNSIIIKFGGTSEDIEIIFEEGTVNAWKTCSSADENGVIECQITLEVKDQDVSNVTLTDILGSNLEFVTGTFKLDGVSVPDLESGVQVNLGDMTIGKHILTYQVQVQDRTNLNDTSNTIKWNWDGNTEGDKTSTTYIHLQGSSVSKNGWQDGEKIKWIITVTPDYHSSVEGIVIKDTLGEGLEYEGEFLIYECDSNGNWTDDSPHVTVAIPDGASGFTHTFDAQTDGLEYQTGRKYVIYYFTSVKDPSVNAKYQNTVNDEPPKEVNYTSSSAEAKADIVSKERTVLDQSSKTITWKITVDPSRYTGDGTITDLTLTDENKSFDYNGYLFDQASLSVTDENGSPVDYTLTWAEDNKSFIIVFTGSFTKDSPEIYVTYEAEPSKDFTGWVDNTVDSSYSIDGKPKTETDHPSIPVNDSAQEGQFSKTGQMNGIEAEWTIYANQITNETHRWQAGDLSGTYVIEDVLPAGMEYVPDSASIGLGQYSALDEEPSKSWQFDSVEVTDGKIIFTFTMDRDKADDLYGTCFVRIRYRTRITDLSSAVSDGDAYRFTNQAQFMQDGTVLGLDGAEVTYTKKILDKSGVLADSSEAYNRINYSIIVNYDGADLVSDNDYVTLVDTLDPNVTLDLNSVKVTDLDTGEQISNCTVSYSSQGQLIIELPDSRALKVMYGVVVAGQKGEKVTVSNSAILTGVASSETTTSNTVTIKETSAGITGKSGSITLKKIDGNSIQTVLSGAEFELVRVEDDGEEVVAAGTTGADGTLTFEKENNGDSLKLNKLYYYVETKAPAGYQQDDTKHYFVLKGDDQDAYQAVIAKYPDVSLDTLTGGNTINVPNVVKTVDISGSKTWVDDGENEVDRPSGIIIKLYADGTYKDQKLVTADDDWKWSFTGLPMCAGGSEITYTISEAEVANYTSQVMGYDVTNTHTPGETGKTVQKIWLDQNDQDGMRPQSIQVQLLADGSAYGDPVELSEDGGWSYSWSGLPVRQNGKTILYTVKEIGSIEGYTTSYSDDSFTITNTHEPEVTAIRGVKIWDDGDDQDGKRPESIIIILLADKKEAARQTVTPDSNGSWSYSFENQPVYQNGKRITYTIEEVVDEETAKAYTSKINGYNVTNTHTPETVKVEGSKTWVDDGEADNRPSSIMIRLSADGTEIAHKEVTAAEGWSWSFTDLPKYKSGNEIKYTITEDPVNNYSAQVNGYDITNTHTPGKTSRTVTKVWQDNNNQDGKRPATIKVQLYAEGASYADKEAYGDEVELNPGNNWSYTWNDLPERKNGKTVTYTVQETGSIAGYTTSYSDDTFTITNTHTPETLKVEGTKTWIDNNNQDGKRPDSITILLLKNETEYLSQVVTPDSNGSWNYSFTNLPKYEGGQEIQYTIKEVMDDKTAREYASVISGYNVTNTHTPETVKVEGSKTWVDDGEADNRPSSIMIRLSADGTEIAHKEVTAAEGWSWSFTDLPKYKSGNEIKYTITEDPVNNYSAQVNGYDITNTHTPGKTSRTVTKVWQDNNNQDGKRPDAIKVQLYAEGAAYADKEAYGSEVELNAVNNWTYTWNDLPEYKNGKTVIYTVQEMGSIAGYTTSCSDDTFTITNTHTPETLKVEGSKIWDDGGDQDGIRPESIIVRLYADDREVAYQEVKGTGNTWSWSFTDLPKFRDQGTEIVYTVKEDQADKYDEAVITGNQKDGFGITNTHTPEKITVEGTKTWIDNDNAEGARPSSITIKLYADDKLIDSRIVKPDGDGNWIWKFENLDRYQDGRLIDYTISEDDVTDYTAKVEGSNVTNTYTPETTMVTVTKKWVDENDADGNRPDAIWVQLYQDKLFGDKEVGVPVKLYEGNHWTYTWNDLPKRGFLTGINYTVKELGAVGENDEIIGITGYTSAVSETTTNNIVITNTLSSLPTPTPEGTPKPTTEQTPYATPGQTPYATPEQTPDATPQATPGAEPSATPQTTPGTEPEITPEPSEETPAPTTEISRTPAPTSTPTREVLGAFRVRDKNVAVLGARRGLDYAVLGKRRRPSTGDSAEMLWWVLALGMAAGSALSSGILLHLKKKE